MRPSTARGPMWCGGRVVDCSSICTDMPTTSHGSNSAICWARHNCVSRTGDRTGGLLGQSSIARLAADARGAPSVGELLRGPTSLGGLLATRGVPAVPSPQAPAPLVGEDYFSGGYNTDRHGSRRGALVDAIQIECHFTGVRDTPDSRARFAGILTDALLVLLRDRYGWTP
jgi:hypothetical protein